MSTNNFINNLITYKAYDHPISHLRVIETHVSWVILTGKFAYKIKKAVNFDFLDFSTLQQRKYYCEQELRLGQQFAPEIYLAVVPITGTYEHPVINAPGPILEYAIKMCEFPQENLLSNLLKQGLVTENIIDQLSRLIADFHKKTTISTQKSHFGLPEEVHAPTKQNFEQIFPFLSNQKDIAKIKKIETWSNEQFKQHRALLQERKNLGFIRDCHGDLHLANIILYKNKPMLFDRLEFNEDLRWIDVTADLAFLLMDLTEKKQIRFSNQLLNTYLSYTADYKGLALLPYYLTYRAVVRAKIALFRLTQPGINNKEKQVIKTEYYNFINLADFYTLHSKPCLIITHGLAGSGKTTIAKNIVTQCGAIQINSDIIRKRLFNLPINSRSKSELNSGIYTPEATKKTYQELVNYTKIIIESGYTAIIDASFLLKTQRITFHELSKRLKVPFYILHCQAVDSEIERRILIRLKNKASVSEANLTILSAQKKIIEPLSDEEKNHTILIDDKSNSLKTALKKFARWHS